MVSCNHSERTDVGRCQTRLDASTPDEHVRAFLKVGGEMDDWASVGGSLRRLQPGYFESEVGEGRRALTRELVICWRS